MPNALPEYKRKSLEKRLGYLIEEYEAASVQLGRLLSAQDRVIVQRQVEHLEGEIEKLRGELGGSATVTDQGHADFALAEQVRSLQAQVREIQDEIQEAEPAPEQTVLRLQLLQGEAGNIEIRGLQVPGGGQPKSRVPLPYSLVDLAAVLKALDIGTFAPKLFEDAYVQSLTELGLLLGDRLHASFHRQVGQTLYDALFSGEIQVALRDAEKSPPVACQLCFDPEDVMLAQFPWELIHDDSTHLLPVKGRMELTRYITFAQPPTPLATKLPLRILFIRPRPKDEPGVADQSTQLLDGLGPLREVEQVVWAQLAPPTWEALEDCLNDERFDVIHFDGHGSLDRVCPARGDALPTGFLHFEDDDQLVDRVSIDELKTVLANSGTRLVFLSACETGVAQGASIFNGIAPGLIQIGIPAVVAMQGSLPDKPSGRFVGRFYASLAEGRRVPEAVNDGRRAIYRAKPVSWFMPVTYLRSSDESYGQLFTFE